MWRLPVLRPIASPARLACWFALVATTLAPGAMHAIDTRLYPIDPSKGDGIGEYVSEANLDLIVARVVAVSDRGATIAHPPLVMLDVERVLRGHVHLGRLRALWVMEDRNVFRCGNETKGEQEAADRYYAQRVHGPRVGARMLLAGWRSEPDTFWSADPSVRFPDSEELRLRIAREAQRADIQRERTAFRRRQQQIAQEATDERGRRAADLRALVRRSTDIVIGQVRPRSRELLVIASLYEAPRNPLAARINSAIEHDFHSGTPGQRLALEGADGAVARLLAAGEAAASARPDSTIPGPYICFLRRCAFVPYESGYYPMAIVDPTAGVLPADSAVVRVVRGIVARESRHGPWTPLPPTECGASMKRFSALDDSALDNIRVRIMYARPGGYAERRQSFVFGVGLSDQDESFIPFCGVCRERAWSDQLMSRYPVSVQRGVIGAWVRTLADLPDAGVVMSPDSVVAIVTVRGQLGGTMRSAERELFDLGLAHAAEALTRFVENDTVAAWRVNYWKYSFGSPIAPQAGWHLMGQ